MNFPAVQICLSFAEAEAAHSRFPEIGVAHYRVRVCKSVEVSVSELFEEERPKLKARHGQVAAGFLEVREVFPGMRLAPNPIGVAAYHLQSNLSSELQGKLTTAKLLADIVRVEMAAKS